MSNSVFKEYEFDTEEFKKLEKLAGILEKASPGGCAYVVDVTYLDLGQDWKWTTIIAYDRSYQRSWQALDPAMYKRVLKAETPEDYLRLAIEYFNDKYCPDRAGMNAHEKEEAPWA